MGFIERQHAEFVAETMNCEYQPEISQITSKDVHVKVKKGELNNTLNVYEDDLIDFVIMPFSTAGLGILVVMDYLTESFDEIVFTGRVFE
jgi:hypothetical protein